VGTALGIVIVIAYFWNDIKNELRNSQKQTTEKMDFNIDSMSENLREKLR
jgi:hypothetical protein